MAWGTWRVNLAIDPAKGSKARCTSGKARHQRGSPLGGPTPPDGSSTGGVAAARREAAEAKANAAAAGGAAHAWDHLPDLVRDSSASFGWRVAKGRQSPSLHRESCG